MRLQDLSPLLISLEVAAIALVIVFFSGIITAWAVSKMKRGKGIMDTVLSLPLVLPPTVVGFILLVFCGSNGPLGKLFSLFDVKLIFTVKGAVIAAVVCSFPIMYRTARGAIDQIEGDLIDAARVMGLGRAGVLFKVIVPLSWPVLVSGALLSFARALGEFGATIMMAGNIPGKTRTMSVAVYTAVQAGDRQLAYTWVLIILLISFVVLLLMNLLLSKKFRRV
ncbi:MAG: molybdate ABC transporter permease subunit [Lachnospiraceae bacterium]|nr:molybdate ABC transporter permease subunit [Lachnospiraceae bacterium]